MTIEHRMLVGLEDIRSIHIECKKCGAKIVRSPDKTLNLPNACSACGADWPQTFGDNPPIVKLMILIASLRASQPETYRFSIEFDYDKLAA